MADYTVAFNKNKLQDLKEIKDFNSLTNLEKEYFLSKEKLTIKRLEYFNDENLLEILIFVAAFNSIYSLGGFEYKKIIKNIKKILLQRLSYGPM